MRMKMIMATVVVAATLSACGTVNWMTVRVSSPVTPQESKAQVIDAAHDIASILDLDVVEALFSDASCSDNGQGPFRGFVRIGYPKATSATTSDAEIAQMAQKLQNQGWREDSDFLNQGTALQKNEVEVVFHRQNISNPGRSIVLYGQCRDVTTTTDTIDKENITEQLNSGR